MCASTPCNVASFPAVQMPKDRVPSVFELCIELVQDDIAEQRGKWTSLRNSLLRPHQHAVRHHHLGLEHPTDENEQSTVLDALPEPRHEPLVRNSIEEFLQIEIHHPFISFCQMLSGFSDRRVAAPPWTKSVALFVERWLVQRFEYQP